MLPVNTTSPFVAITLRLYSVLKKNIVLHVSIWLGLHRKILL